MLMKSSAFRAVLTFFIGFCPHVVHAQELSASDILKKIAETYEGVSSFSVVAEKKVDIDTDTIGEMNNQLNPKNEVRVGSHESEYIQVTLVASNRKAKLLLKHANKEVAVVNDGNTVWTEIPSQHAYTELMATSATAQNRESTEIWGGNLLLDYESLLDRRFQYLATYQGIARLEHSETLKVGKKRKECYVLTIQERGSPQKQKLWVDKTNFTVWKSVDRSRSSEDFWGDVLQTTVTLTIKQMTLNSSLDENNFVFTPLGSAKRVDSLKVSGNNPF